MKCRIIISICLVLFLGLIKSEKTEGKLLNYLFDKKSEIGSTIENQSNLKTEKPSIFKKLDELDEKENIFESKGGNQIKKFKSINFAEIRSSESNYKLPYILI